MKKGRTISTKQGNYKLVENIGNGGSGTVWKVLLNDEFHALKIINSNNEEKSKRFQNEIEFCKKANHKNIIKIIDEGTYDNKKFHVMPLYPSTFKEIIEKETNPRILINYILKICNAIKYIHKNGHIHRDIKPENILVKGKEIVLADFGIAHFKNNLLTKKNELLANRNYAAPEQKIKNNSLNITYSADIFSLGLLINECFTKSNPTGSEFKLISEVYPIHSEFDDLVENMLNQNHLSRPKIEDVITQIKFILKKIKHNLILIQDNLTIQTTYYELKPSIKRSIIRKASEDILLAKIIFETKTPEELNKYNTNWHMRIGYDTDEFLYNLYVQEKIHELCKAKFDYESNVYSNINWYNPLDLNNNPKHKKLYKKLNDILSKYKLQNYGVSYIDLTGEILKYFHSCVDYHCIEIINKIKDIENSAKTNLKNAPIMWIVNTLKRGIIQNIEFLIKKRRLFGRRYDFDFSEHISLCNNRIKTFHNNPDDNNLFDADYLRKKNETQKILLEFQRKWKIIFNHSGNDEYSIKFKTYNIFNKFKNYSLDFAKPYYIFEGDVLDIFSAPQFIGNMVELKLESTFEIRDTIAKIIGLKEIDEYSE